MRPAFRKRLEQREAESIAIQRRQRLLFLAIVAAFAIAALIIFLRSQSPAGLSGPIDINKASAAQLDKLPEVGPAMAREIIKGRPYQKPEDLLKVKGIGPKTLEKIRPQIELSD